MTSPETVIFVSLGSNIEPEQNLRAAVRLLREWCAVLAVSSAYRTAPQGYSEQADFLNLAVKLTTAFDPAGFKSKVIVRIEGELKRVRDPQNKNAPRTIDLDISLWGGSVIEYGDKPWRVPDKDILRFAHVAIPLAEIAPEYVHPEDGRRLKDIAAQFDHEGIERMSLDL